MVDVMHASIISPESSPGIDFLPETIRNDFPILKIAFDGNPLVYLDNAATTQKPRTVLDSIIDYYSTTNSNIGRGYYKLSIAATDRYEEARGVVQGTLNAEYPDEIVFTRSTTEAINMLADTFGQRLVGNGDQIVISGLEHNSNLLPWRRLCEKVGAALIVVPVNACGRVEVADFSAAMGPRVKLAAISHVSNVLGTVNPVRTMIDHAHRRGIPVVVDGAQAVPHQQVDVRHLDADFYCFSGHKVYGPMGIGVLYGKRQWLTELQPYQVGGGTVKGVTYDEPVEYVPAPARLEAGTPNIEGAVGLAAALRYLQGIGWKAVRRHDQLLVHRAVRMLEEIDGVRVIGEPATDSAGIVSFTVDGIHPYDVGGHLDAHGVAVRCGVHCASTFLDSMGLLGTVRISFAVYNTAKEVDLVGQVLRSARPGFWTAEHPATRFL